MYVSTLQSILYKLQRDFFKIIVSCHDFHQSHIALSQTKRASLHPIRLHLELSCNEHFQKKTSKWRISWPPRCCTWQVKAFSNTSGSKQLTVLQSSFSSFSGIQGSNRKQNDHVFGCNVKRSSKIAMTFTNFGTDLPEMVTEMEIRLIFVIETRWCGSDFMIWDSRDLIS